MLGPVIVNAPQNDLETLTYGHLCPSHSNSLQNGRLFHTRLTYDPEITFRHVEKRKKRSGCVHLIDFGNRAQLFYSLNRIQQVKALARKAT